MDVYFWTKWFEKKYTLNEVKELLSKIKEFKAGIIDTHLNKHIDNKFNEWIEKSR